MKNIFKIKSILPSIILLSVLLSCTSDINNITNENDPDFKKVLKTGNDLTSVVAGGFSSWWQAGNRDTYAALGVAGDIATCSWGNYGMRTLSNEPRNSIPNSVAWSDSSVLTQPWEGYYAAASNASDVIKAIQEGVVYTNSSGVDETNGVLATAYFLRGISFGYLGLLFDKSAYIDETYDPTTNPELLSYDKIIEKALIDLQKSINLSNANTFTMPANLINGYIINNINLLKLANSYSARFIVQSSRTLAETNAIDWLTVKNYAENGITEDFGPKGDNGVSWWSNVSTFSNSPNGFDEFGGRLDMRIINMIDSSQPMFYPTVGTLNNTVINTTDNRMTTDFGYRSGVEFSPARGRYHFSHYISIRYSTDTDFSDGLDTKRLITFAKADNDLLLAEANARLSMLPNAITIINNGTRVTRGNLAPISTGSNQTQVLNAIFYERYLELFNTALGSGFFDRRRTNQLQKGTFRHFPIPAKTLQVLKLPIYTFGGETIDPTGMVSHNSPETNVTRTTDINLPTFN